MPNEINMPLPSQELIDALAQLFPDRCPSLKDSDREVWFKAGAAYVVEFLQNERDRQQEEDEPE